MAEAARYNNVAVAFHWVTAFLVVTQIYVGWTFGHMERGPERGEWFAWHKTLGVLILMLSVGRLWWRLANPPPPLPSELPGWERVLAKANHLIFYIALIALPLTGWATISSGGGAQESAFTSLIAGIPFPFIPGLPESTHDGFEATHKLLAWSAVALVALHVGAALKHQFVDRSPVANRMPPFRVRN
jgi:cytochrome b561